MREIKIVSSTWPPPFPYSMSSNTILLWQKPDTGEHFVHTLKPTKCEHPCKHCMPWPTNEWKPVTREEVEVMLNAV